jgi:hypothetical protein
MTLGVVWTECAIWRGKSDNLIPTRLTSVDLVFLRFENIEKISKKSQKTIDKSKKVWYNGFTQRRKEREKWEHTAFLESPQMSVWG